MAIRFRFYDSVDGDRVNNSDAWAQWARALVGEGYAPGVGGELAVGEADPAAMSVVVQTGIAWVDGRYFEIYSGAETLVIPDADGSNARYDRIVIRNNFDTRETTLEVLAGTPAASPALPALTRNSTIYEISLANVFVAAAASSVDNGDITDERSDGNLCGRADPLGLVAHMLASPIEHPDGSVTAAKLADDYALQSAHDAHTGNTSNPHSVSAAQAGAAPATHGAGNHDTSVPHARAGGRNIWVQSSAPTAIAVGDIWIETV